MSAPLLLAIETSCDETSAAVVRGRSVLSNVVASQLDMHAQWGGVVPEAAARAHVEALIPTLESALTVAGVTLNQIEGFAVTNRPGLVGALSVGATAAAGLAWQQNRPIYGIHHLEGHLLSVMSLADEIIFPHLALIVSGGHTKLVEVRRPGLYTERGETRDDAAGEAFDKGARLLGLGYPGGYAVQQAALLGNKTRYQLPRGLAKEPNNFSFSGLKTAMNRLVEKEGTGLNIADAAASLQEAIVEVLSLKMRESARQYEMAAISLVGGVAANVSLRERISNFAKQDGLAFYCPEFSLCTDNAAMIGLAAAARLAEGNLTAGEVEVSASAPLRSGN